MISCLLAMDRNRGIGYQNELPWYLPEDLKYFKKITMGHTIVMGRKTFESIGKALPGRNNVILTRDVSLKQPEGTKLIHSIDELLRINEEAKNEEIFVIGGAEIFKQVLPFTDKLYITEIEKEYKVDTFFPEIDRNEWALVSTEPGAKMDEVNTIYHFRVYQRKTK